MHEQEKSRGVPDGASEFSRDMSPAPEDIAHSLASFPIERMSAAHGPGFRYPIGGESYDEPVADLEHYPERKVIRYSTPDIQLILRNTQEPQLMEHGVIFVSSSDYTVSSLVVGDMGEVTLYSSANYHDEPLRFESNEPPRETREKQERVNLTGYAGRDPWAGQTKNGIDITRFPLAQHSESETGEKQTTWHNVVAFRGVAQDVKETVHKGAPLRVVGYKNDTVDKDGVMGEEIIAASVRPTRKLGGKE